MISNGISYYLNSFTPFTSTPMGSSLKNSPETSASEVAPVLVNGIDLHPRHVPEQPRQWCGSCERLVLWLALDQESLGRTMHWADQKQRILMMEKGWTTMEKWWKNDGTMMKNGKMMEQWWKMGMSWGIDRWFSGIFMLDREKSGGNGQLKGRFKLNSYETYFLAERRE